MTILIATIIYAILFFIVFISLFYTAVRYAPFVPTQSVVTKKMVAAAQLQDGQKVYDLGCGDARLLIEAKRQKNVTATGVEVNLFVCLLAKFRSWLAKKDVIIIRKNFFDVPLQDANVIFCYLFPKLMQDLKLKFTKELQAGALVISYCFPIQGWKPEKTIPTRDDKPNNFLIYIYRMPCQTT